jgi:NTP pyrophosphatase (non-canonical NTP hydrolase)
MAKYSTLDEAIAARQAVWDPEGKTETLEFCMLELCGETGETANVVKKLERERLGVIGTRATPEDLMDELADIVICAHRVARAAGIKLHKAVPMKFNETSHNMGIDVYMEVP